MIDTLSDGQEKVFLFIGVNQDFLQIDQKDRNSQLESVKDTIKTQFGDLFEIDNIFIFNELPKRIKSSG